MSLLLALLPPQTPGVAYTYTNVFTPPSEELPPGQFLDNGENTGITSTIGGGATTLGYTKPPPPVILASPLDVLSPAMQPWALPPQQSILNGIETYQNGYLNVTGQFGSLLVQNGTPLFSSIAFIQAANNNAAPGTSVACTFSSPNTAGNLIVLYISTPGTAPLSISDTAGNTYHLATSAGTVAFIYYAWNIASKTGNVVTVTWSGSNYYQVSACEYSGAQNTTDPLDGNNVLGSTGSGGTLTVATGNAGDLVCSVIECGTSGGITSFGRVRYNFNFGSNIDQDQMGGPGKVNVPFSFSSSGTFNVAGAAFKPQVLGPFAVVLNAQTDRVGMYPMVELPPFEAIENGESNGITGAFGGQISTGPLAPVVGIAYLSTPFLLPPFFDIPPWQLITDGSLGEAIGAGLGQTSTGAGDAAFAAAFVNRSSSPFRVDLPMFDGVTLGDGGGILGAFAGQLSTTKPSAATTVFASIFKPDLLLPPSTDLPPPQELFAGFTPQLVQLHPTSMPIPASRWTQPGPTAGFGQAAQPPVVYKQDLLPPVADLPPTQDVLAGVTIPAISFKPSMMQARSTRWAPQSIAGFGQAAQAPVIVLPFLLPPTADLPPLHTQFLAGYTPTEMTFIPISLQARAGRWITPAPYAGAGNPAQPPVIIDNIFLPPVADLPPPITNLLKGIIPTAVPFAPIFPQTPLARWVSPIPNAGFGQAAQSPVVIKQDLLPPATDLPPAQEMLFGTVPTANLSLPTSIQGRSARWVAPAPVAGFGQAAQPPVIVVGPPDSKSPYPTTTAELLKGFGNPAQPPVITKPDLLPPTTDLPPVPDLLVGFGPFAQAAPQLFRAARQAQWISPAPAAGFSTYTPTLVLLKPDLLPPSTDLPPLQELLGGFETPAYPFPQTFVKFGTGARWLPPAPAAGFGQAAQPPVLYKPDLLPPATDLPPPQELLAGFTPTLVQLHPSAMPIASSRWMSPGSTAGFGQAAQAPVTVTQDLIPSFAVDLPPPQEMLAGFGNPAQSPVVYKQDLIPSYATDLPPVQELLIGSVIPAISFKPNMIQARSTRWTSPSPLAGFGQAAQAPVIVLPFLLPPTADLPPLHTQFLAGYTPTEMTFIPISLQARSGRWITPAPYAGAGNPATAPVIIDNIFLPPTTDLPPPITNLLKGIIPTAVPFAPIFPQTPLARWISPIPNAGFGQAAQAPVVIKQDLLPPATDLPPAPDLLAGFGPSVPAVPQLFRAARQVQWIPPPSPGFGTQPTIPTILKQDLLPPSTDLPPLDYYPSGFGNPAQPPVIVVGPPDPRSPYPTTTAELLAGFGYPAQAPVIVIGPPDPRNPYPTVTAELLAGFGYPAQPPVIVRQDLLPPTTDLPPQDYVLKGFGQAAQPPVVIVGPPDSRSPYPTTTAQLLAGFGYPAQPPVIYSQPPTPPSTILPPTDYVFSGFGQAAQAPVLVRPDLLPPSTDLPPPQVVLVGFETPAYPLPQTFVKLGSARWLPPAPSAGFGQAAQPPVIYTVPPAPPETQLPPRDVLSSGQWFTGTWDAFTGGFGQAAQPPVIYTQPLVPPSTTLPPQDYVYAGFGQAAQAPVIVFPFLIPPTADLPPPHTALLYGAGAPAQAAVIYTLPPAPPEAQLPPRDALSSGQSYIGTWDAFTGGFGYPAQPPVVYTQPIVPPSTILPPQDYVYAGFGQAAQPPVIYRQDLLPPSTDLPPVQAVAKGFGYPAQPPVIVVGPPDARIPYPTTTAQLLAGFGFPAQPPVVYTQPLVPPSTILPPQDYVITGFGQAAQPPVLVQPFLLPSLAELPPPHTTLNYGFGQAAQPPFTAPLPPNPPFSLLPPQQFLTSGGTYYASTIDAFTLGYGQAPQAAVIYRQDLLPPTVDLPPQDYLLKGFGFPAQLPVVYSDIFALGAPRTDLPPQDYNPAGYGQAAQAPVIVIGPPDSRNPYPTTTAQLLAGFGYPAQPPVTYSQPAAPPSALLPPTDSLYAGFGFPAQPPVIYAQPAAPPSTLLPPQDYILKGFGQAAQSPVLVQPFLLPSLAELPPQHTTLNLGFGQAAQPPFTAPLPPNPPFSLLPPQQFLSSGSSFYATSVDALAGGFGYPAQSPVIYRQDLLPPTADLPPQDFTLRGFGFPAQPPVIYTQPIVPPSTILPPQDYIAVGFGYPAQAPAIYSQPLVPPSAILPPQDYVFTGFGQASQSAVVYSDVFALGAPRTDLPPQDYHPSGFGYPAQPPVIVIGPPDARNPYPTTTAQLLAGFGFPAQPPVVYTQPIVPPSTILPPQDYVITGFGQPAQAPVVVQPFVLPPLADLPPQHTTLNYGFGQAAQPPFTAPLPPSPPFALLPPQQFLTSGSRFYATSIDAFTGGFGQAAEASFFVSPFLLPPETLLPPKDYVFAGFGNPAQPPVIVVGPPDARNPYPTVTAELLAGFGYPAQPPVIYPGAPPPFVPDLPPPQKLYAGFGQAAQPPVVYSIQPAPYAVLPPTDYIFKGFGQAAQPPVIYTTDDNSVLTPFSADLPPYQWLSSGFSQTFGGVDAFTTGFGFPVKLYSPPPFQPFLPPSTDLPPAPKLYAGHGQAAQPPVLVYQDLYPAPYAVLPPQDYILKGFGQAAQPPVVYKQDLLPPSTDLPPQDFTIQGFGYPAQPPVIVVGPPDAKSPYPTTTAQLLAGFGYPSQPPVVYRQDLLPPATDLPPQDYVLKGHGFPAQPPVVYTQPIVPPNTILPPTDYVFAGFGQAAQRAQVFQPFVPPSTDLPPHDYVYAGHGQAAQRAQVFQPFVPPSTDLPPIDYVFAGYGQTAQLAVLVQPVILPPATLLPPTDYVFAGFGNPAQRAAVFQPFVPPTTDLPPTDYVFAGYGQAAQRAALYQPFVPPSTDLPPHDYIFAGHGFPAQSAHLFQPFLTPPTTDLPPQDYVLKGYNVPVAHPMLEAFTLPPDTLLPPHDYIYAGFGPVAVTAHLTNLLPPTTDLPPEDYIAKGFGTPAQRAALFQPFVPPSTDLPPTNYVSIGHGQAAQPPVIIPASLAPLVPDLPPPQMLARGYGLPAQAPFIVSLPAPSPYVDLPPEDYIVRGFGTPTQRPVIYPGVPAPVVPDLPPPQTLAAGFGSPAQKAQLLQAYDVRDVYPTAVPKLFAGYGQTAQAPEIIHGPADPLSPYPTTTAELLKGFGQAAQPAFIYVQPPAQYVSLPPLSVLLRGYNPIHVPPIPIVRITPVSQIIARPYWLDLFKQHELPLYVYEKDAKNRKHMRGPYAVSYTLFMVRDLFLEQIGPSYRTPAPGPKVGHFYVTGVVGEGGQPGIWMVRWTVQETFNAQPITKDYYFEVLDAVSAHFPDDTTPRKPKRGWD